MVRFFAAGLFVGFPLGCYLREQGYHKRIQAAYKVLKPGDDGKCTLDQPFIPSHLVIFLCRALDEQASRHHQRFLQRLAARTGRAHRFRAAHLWAVWRQVIPSRQERRRVRPVIEREDPHRKRIQRLHRQGAGKGTQELVTHNSLPAMRSVI